MLVTMDGNDSLKRIRQHAIDISLQDSHTALDSCGKAANGEEHEDNQLIYSSVYLEQTAVDRFDRQPGVAPEPQAPLAGSAKAKGKGKELLDEDKSPCSGRWSNMSKEATGKSWALFDETGIFLCLCHHGFALAVCDMVKSGEQCVHLHCILSYIY